jgi:hypothetical protein
LRLRALVIAALAVFMAVGNLTYRLNQHHRELVDEVYAQDRYVDISVLLRTVVADPNGEELIPGKPKLRVVREQVFGGWVDTKLDTPRLVERDEDLCPVVWYCSEEQEPIVRHGNDVQPLFTVGTAPTLADVPLGQLVYGSEGAGKTTTLVMWIYFRWLELLGGKHWIGVSSPTEPRLLKTVFKEFTAFWPADWYSYSVSEGIATLVDDTTLLFASTTQQSAEQGSRWQGFNLAAHAGDEFQDSLNVADDIEMRGRSAPNGRYKRLITATAKDSPDWRTFRDRMLEAKDESGAAQWIKRTLYGERSPFVPASFWIKRRASLSPREAKRRLDAMDLPPERATYPTWDREKNMIVVPDIAGWRDITAAELAQFTGEQRVVLTGHDPGNLVDVSLFLKEYAISTAEAKRIGAPTVTHDLDGNVIRGVGPPPIWVVHDEISTCDDSHDAHILEVLKLARERWQCNLRNRAGQIEGPQIFVRADPAGDNDNKTDMTVYTQWRNHGVDIRPAVYSRVNPTKHGRVPRDPGIEVVNTLLCNSYGERRLFIAKKADGTPAAPRLVAAIETSERDLAGKAETQLKRKGDVSHWPAALRYALWLIERPRLGVARGAEEAKL